MKSWNEIKNEVLNNVVPLYDKKYTLNAAKQSFIEYDNDDDYEINAIEQMISEYPEIAGTILFLPPSYDDFKLPDDDISFGFGFGVGYNENCNDVALDDQGLLQFVIEKMFKPLVELNLFDPSYAESCSCIQIKEPFMFDEKHRTIPIKIDGFPTNKKDIKNELLDLVTTVIGKSLSDPSIEQKKIKTDDCKTAIFEKFKINKTDIKRTSKYKFGLFDIRVFNEKYTLVEFDNRIIMVLDEE